MDHFQPTFKEKFAVKVLLCLPVPGIKRHFYHPSALSIVVEGSVYYESGSGDDTGIESSYIYGIVTGYLIRQRK